METITESPKEAKQESRLTWEDWVGAGILAALVLMTFCNVLARYLSSQSFAWTEEISVFLLLAMSLVGIAATVAAQDTIRIDFILQRMGPAGKRCIHIATALLGLLIFGLLGVLYTQTGWTEWTYEETTSGTGAPRWAYTVWLAILAVVVAVRFLQACWRALKQQEV